MPFEIDLGGGMSYGLDGHMRTNIGGTNLSLDLNDGSVGYDMGNVVIDFDSNDTNDQPTVDRVETRTTTPAKPGADAPEKPGLFGSIKNAFKKLFS